MPPVFVPREAERGSKLLYKPEASSRGYVYLMQKDEVHTLRVIMKIKNVMLDRRIFLVPDDRNDKKYWGWMRFAKPLPLWEAMEAGLVPLFNMYRNDAS